MTQQALNHRARVIVGIDDQAENLLLLKAIVEHHGDVFHGATSGEEGLSVAARTAPRLILLDVQMPGMDGFETCRQLRRLFALRETPIAFLTARKSGEDVREGIKAGGNDFISKPFDPLKLVARIDHWCAHRVKAA